MIRAFLLAALLLASVSQTGMAQTSETFLEAIRNGSTSGNFLLRGEAVDAEAFDDAAVALTLRTQLGYQTATYRGWSFYSEFEAVSAVLGDEEYNNAGSGDYNNGVRDRPVIADPQGAEVNQGWLRLAQDTYQVTLGRQEIVLSDSRFVGNVGWRQNHQSYDAARVDVMPSDRLSGTYAFVREAHRITRHDATMRSHIAEGRLLVGDIGRLTAFAFVMDYPNAAALSRSTFGARFEGARDVNDEIAAAFELSYAKQQDAFDNPASIDADYMVGSLGLSKGPSGIAVRYESLSGSPANGAFVTPLATLHKFNGWADVFLATPVDGLVDLQVILRHRFKDTSVSLVGHDFGAQDGDRHHGREVDLVVSHPLPSGQQLGFKLAHYMADETGADVTKAWIWTRLSF